jgi:hypothetical protein
MMSAITVPNQETLNIALHIPTKHDSSDDRSMSAAVSNKCTEQIIMSVVRHMKQPSSDIKKFDGSPLEYRRFIRQFKTKVVQNTDDDDERLNFLEQYTVGEAHKIVSGLSYLEASTGYTAALRELEARYGEPDVVVNSFIKKALSWPNIKPNDVKGIDNFSIFLIECHNAVQSMDAVKVLDYSENMKQLVAKLPYHLHDRWRNQVYRTKELGEAVLFKHLVEFVRREAKKANDPVYGRESMGIDLRDRDRKTSNTNF